MIRLWRLVGESILILSLAIGASLLISGRTRPMPTFMALFMTNADGSLCGRPCLIGIQPDKMTLRNAITELKQHPFSRYLPVGLRSDAANWIGRDFNFVLGKGSNSAVISIYINFSEAFSQGRLVGDGPPLTVSVGDVITSLGKPYSIYTSGNDDFAWLYYPADRLMISVQLLTQDADHLTASDPDPVQDIYLPPASAYHPQGKH